MKKTTLMTIRKPVRYEENVKRSGFICSASRVKSAEEARSFIQQISGEYRNATHNCWAYRVFENGQVVEASSDAGEPSGTAGRPILDALRKLDLVNMAVVVTRYFGGVKLGKRGLIEAYGGVTERALSDVEKAQLVLMNVYRCDMDYSEYERTKSRLERDGGRVLKAHYTDRVVFEAAVPQDRDCFLRRCTFVDTRLVEL